MKLDFIPLGRLSVSKTNMRFGKKPPDVTDLLPSVRQRGVLQPVIVRPNCAPDGFEIIAGARRFTAACLVSEERRASRGDDSPDDVLLPCAILDGGDDAAAVEASLIENIARRDADEVTQWATFTRLIKEGRSAEDIAATFGLPDLGVKRILALGNLLPRIRSLYAQDEIDAGTIRPLTLASKRQQQEWLAQFDDPQARAPTGHQVKAWLFGGQSVAVGLALFDVAQSGLTSIADLFGEDRYFADASAFWSAQDEAIAARREEYLANGWSEVVIVPPSDYFQSWEYDKLAKRKGGKVYVDVRASGEVTFHEGYISRREAARIARGETSEPAKAERPELTSALQTYVDLHRHAAVRAALIGHSGVALRLMLAHLIVGSPLWNVRREPQAAPHDETRESVENSPSEAAFDERRRAVLALLGMFLEQGTVICGNGDDYALVGLFLRLLDLPDAALGDIIVVAVGETLQAGSATVEAIGMTLGLNMADHWQPDQAFFALLRDKEVLGQIVAEVAGEAVASANAKEKGVTLKQIVADHLGGVGGRAKVERWVPRWMAFPPSAYTARGGVATVKAYAKLAAAKAEADHEHDTDPLLPEVGNPPSGPGDGNVDPDEQDGVERANAFAE